MTTHQRFLDKRNYAYWVGRIHFKGVGERDHQRYVLDQCGRKLRKDGDRRAGIMSINGGGTDDMSVRLAEGDQGLGHGLRDARVVYVV